jgi:hypothetical protein
MAFSEVLADFWLFSAMLIPSAAIAPRKLFTLYQRIEILGTRGVVAQAEELAEKVPSFFCHSERSEESLLLFLGLDGREIPRFARNDKINHFFRSL